MIVDDKYDPVRIAADLIRVESESPAGDDIMDVVISYLKPLGFKCNIIKSGDVTNLYAKLDKGGKNLCFAGHTDVVPAGVGWSVDPYTPVIKDGYLWGRGAVDMKSSIAAFISAVARIKNHNGSISFMLTGNEEQDSTHGTPVILEWLKARDEVIDDCLVGEMTSRETLGDVIKPGRRGSTNYRVEIKGTQGHVAYPEHSKNPVPIAANIVKALSEFRFNDSDKVFDDSNLEVTSVDMGSNAVAKNLISKSIFINFNVRQNIHQDQNSLDKIVEEIISNFSSDYDIKMISYGSAFLVKTGKGLEKLIKSVSKITGLEPELSTEGGTSDARFIHQYTNSFEFGHINKLAHKIDERVSIKDQYQLTDIFEDFILSYHE